MEKISSKSYRENLGKTMLWDSFEVKMFKKAQGIDKTVLAGMLSCLEKCYMICGYWTR